MPKMPEEFYLQKREEILDAAQRIVLQKPLPHVSMKDLIRACGVSQGAIYHYFSGLDEIWLGLVERLYRADDLLASLRQLFVQPLPPAETVCRAAKLLCDNLLKTVPGYGKLLMELNTLVQANPAQYGALANPAQSGSRLDEMEALFAAWCSRQQAQGALRPRVSQEQVLLHMSATYLGLRYQACALQQQGLGAGEFETYIALQQQTWQTTMLYLLGLEANHETV